MQRCSSCAELRATADALRHENADLRGQIDSLRDKLQALERAHVKAPVQPSTPPIAQEEPNDEPRPWDLGCSLTPFEMERYGRQMLVREFGATAQRQIRQSRVLVVGLGGLGSPVAMYLAAMGVGTLGLADHDHVARSNLHRQVLYDESMLGCPKAPSARHRLERLNPHLRYECFMDRVGAVNALNLVGSFDVIVDASDNPSTRYLLNAACQMLGRPLVSASALGLEGQVTVFAFHAARKNGAIMPCYQCVYPSPPREPLTCAENGVLGVVPGVLGCLQAMETVKLLTSVGTCLQGRQCFYDAYEGVFRAFKLPRQRQECPTCAVTRATPGEMQAFLWELEESMSAAKLTCDAGMACATPLLDKAHEVDARAFATMRKEPASTRGYVLVDVRPRHQFEIVHFPEAVNIPLPELLNEQHEDVVSKWKTASKSPVVVICRRGVDSVRATEWLLEHGVCSAVNVRGGYTEYAKAIVEEHFPMY